mmetsp:Transcript_4402/g.7493  ORF Transcript_4402/g.7493 Transcript_4402/m.7493 type:complete len:736 (-) Transcript_4402:693-2900(-)|eukprot:CAMPEP_0184340206 /NCGR_PEP_ID=MMETSP1089-20130417/8886_1 /TAXON_ID=38269 ORGANISM="Gloeochaete wittrockiana, Strain SAG46.84" /NCGR_SAMPLE_ID=MMETSP1089 /ASSEMBLY_ACC=CAM_ASM_000445 /LENGTH=735 /DNA_ID=CAMNT_0026667911 /DNA_START=174 /DNA_END=2381 /DNA_ORIENTATION=+
MPPVPTYLSVASRSPASSDKRPDVSKLEPGTAAQTVDLSGEQGKNIACKFDLDKVQIERIERRSWADIVDDEDSEDDDFTPHFVNECTSPADVPGAPSLFSEDIPIITITDGSNCSVSPPPLMSPCSLSDSISDGSALSPSVRLKFGSFEEEGQAAYDDSFKLSIKLVSRSHFFVSSVCEHASSAEISAVPSTKLSKNKKKTKKTRAAVVAETNTVPIIRKPAANQDTVAEDVDDLYVAMYEGQVLDLKRTETRGRGMYANRDIAPGELVHSSFPYVTVVNDNFLESFCHGCFEPIENHIWCDGCRMAWYCSSRCKEKHTSESHTPEMCSTLTRMYGAFKDDTATARLVLGVLYRRKQEMTQGYISGETSYDDVLRLLPHSSEMKGEVLNEVKAIAKLLTPLLTDDIRLASDEALFDLICRIKCNHHGLDDLNNRRYGLGVYPRACFFNHSCRPNVTYTIDGGVLSFRAITPIKQGTEACLSYTDLYQVTPIRQKNLMESYFFQCNCGRCSETPDENLDCFLAGFRCPIPKCPGVLKPVVQSDSTTEAKAGGEALKCSKCGEIKDNVQQLKSAEVIADAFLQRGVQLREDGLYVESRHTLEQLLTLYEKILHPHHAILFHTYAGLMNACNAVLDLNVAANYCRKLIHLMESVGVYPRYHPDLCAHYGFLGNALLCIATTAPCSDPSEQAALLERSLLAFKRAYELLKVVRGEEHPATRETFAKISRVQQSKRMLL